MACLAKGNELAAEALTVRKVAVWRRFRRMPGIRRRMWCGGRLSSPASVFFYRQSAPSPSYCSCSSCSCSYLRSVAAARRGKGAQAKCFAQITDAAVHLDSMYEVVPARVDAQLRGRGEHALVESVGLAEHLELLPHQISIFPPVLCHFCLYVAFQAVLPSDLLSPVAGSGTCDCEDTNIMDPRLMSNRNLLEERQGTTRLATSSSSTTFIPTVATTPCPLRCFARLWSQGQHPTHKPLAYNSMLRYVHQWRRKLCKPNRRDINPAGLTAFSLMAIERGDTRIPPYTHAVSEHKRHPQCHVKLYMKLSQ